jgi:8-oxo-dGTP pyrophosphatase MutT (NUDIX family)
VIDALLDEVRRRTPVDERERTSIERFLAEIPTLARPFDEHADPRHVTASAIVVGPRGVVLHKHKRLGLWLQPGGHVDENETPADAAVRESVEETGLPVAHAGRASIIHVDVHPGPRGHTHFDVRYLLEAPDAEPAPAEGESQDVRWFAWDDAIALADHGLAGALRSLKPEPH